MLHLVGFLLILNYDARNHEPEIRRYLAEKVFPEITPHFQVRSEYVTVAFSSTKGTE